MYTVSTVTVKNNNSNNNGNNKCRKTTKTTRIPSNREVVQRPKWSLSVSRCHTFSLSLVDVCNCEMLMLPTGPIRSFSKSTLWQTGVVLFIGFQPRFSPKNLRWLFLYLLETVCSLVDPNGYRATHYFGSLHTTNKLDQSWHNLCSFDIIVICIHVWYTKRRIYLWLFQANYLLDGLNIVLKRIMIFYHILF